MSTPASTAKLQWEHADIEKRFGFKAARFTGVNMLLAFLLGLLLGVLWYLALFLFMETHLGQMFYARGVVPYAITVLAGWSLAILFLKWRKLVFQESALPLQVVPPERSFALTAETAHVVLDNIYQVVDNPRHFIVFNRIDLALSNLRNIGRISDVDDILRSQAENDENQVESSYTILKGFIWAIPVLGFIGTVLGLSQAIGSFGSILSEGAEMSQLQAGLRQVTAGLAVAFETTLVALVMALLIQLLLTTLKKREETFLDECLDYSLRYVVSRLRLTELGPLAATPLAPAAAAPAAGTAPAGDASGGASSKLALRPPTAAGTGTGDTPPPLPSATPTPDLKPGSRHEPS